ncbi:MAG: inorganic phosphate transporter [Paludibacterium sp.]|uniref:inorganic phosphate transporter n=1 Tax=Paludibacterium sp. TaxID=1917523 RepID=UPI0025E44804|nr:inorganic phosphate transporter [Paludibacterium sp.]MBV8048628.1 inorganic phosphate transporter [Paludibacterium sp.]MBV8649116.1 inorganic phosphate transporter [Paludibacterium sp.]
MLALFSGLDFRLAITLFLSLGFVLTFEFINGFHDTANAVATVIYTQSMKPRLAVFASGLCNFLGVLSGGLAVAYAIVHLLPVDLLVSVNTAHGMSMVFALLAAAILWNFGTWYLGLPASSSHTLIGAILGVGLANALITHAPLSEGINWGKAIEVGMSLLLSPIVGFVLAGIIIALLRHYRGRSNMHKTPYQRQQVEGRKHPPFWTRFMLIVSAMGVSFAHGSNDGQKGVGLIMLVLIGIVPANYVLNMDSNPYQIERTRDAALHLKQFYTQHDAGLHVLLAKSNHSATHGCNPSATPATVDALNTVLDDNNDYHNLTPEQRWDVRTRLLCLDDATKLASQLPHLTDGDKRNLQALRGDLTQTTEYAPTWVILSVALALGVGTMIGWRRVVKTVGEGIGKKDMTYAQGMAAQITAAISIGLASVFGMPVSTTHVLSSGVAGAMVADKSGLQFSTIRAILLAWLFTLPVSMALAAGLYYLASLWIP